MAIGPEIERATHAIEMDENTGADPGGGRSKSRRLRADRIALGVGGIIGGRFGGDARRINLEGIAGAEVVWACHSPSVPSLEGTGMVTQAASCKISGKKIRGPFVGFGHPV